MTACRCRDHAVLWGPEADDYVSAHLVREDVEEGAREVVYRCPGTGRGWVLDIADDEAGGASLRLRWLLTTAELVEHLASTEDIDEHEAYWAPDFEFVPIGSNELIRGREAARRFAETAAADPEYPRPTPISLVENGDDVLVLGSVSVSRGGRYTETRPAAWHVTSRRGRLTYSRAYDSWEEARTAAGIPDGTPLAERTRRLRRGFLFAIGRALTPGPAPQPGA